MVDFSGVFVYGNMLKRHNWDVWEFLPLKPIMCGGVKEVNKNHLFTF